MFAEFFGKTVRFLQ